MTDPNIALLTDFGEEDWFVGTMKGVIRTLAPSAAIIDISHQVPPYDIRGGALTLWCSYKYFPAGTVFCCVVDPGVGTERSALCATDGKYFFTAPDNGLLSMAARDAGRNWKAYHARDERFHLPDVSTTFHGRDIFAPLAARLALGTRSEETGPAVPEPVTLNDDVPVVRPDGALEGTVLYADRFGNLITNIRREHDGGENCRLKIRNIVIPGISRTFADKKKDEILFYWGSSDLLEIAVNQGNAFELLEIEIGESVLFIRE